MSYSIKVVSCNKEKLKEAIRMQQCKDEVNNPHSGVPTRVADYLCAEVDRVRVYEYQGMRMAISIDAHGSFHEQGSNDTSTVTQIQLVE